MANKKTGFQFWSVETDRYQDIKIKRLKKEFKGTGLAIYDYLLNEIYRDKGCYMEWDASTAFDVAEFWDIKETALNEIVNYCCHLGLFNKELMVNERLISSESILKRFIYWSKIAKRSEMIIPEKLKILLEESPKLPEECTQTSGSLPQPNLTLPNLTKPNQPKRAPGAPDDPDFSLNLIKEKFSESFFSTWQKWKDYKAKEFKFKYKSQESETAAITELLNISGKNETTAGAIIQQSMAKGWKGFFELEIKQENKNSPPAGQKINEGPPPGFVSQSQKMKREINYLYGRFLEGECTTVSIEIIYYDFLKKQGMAEFSEEKKQIIRKMAVDHINEKKLALNDNSIIAFMKKIGVIEIFKAAQSEKKENIFNED